MTGPPARRAPLPRAPGRAAALVLAVALLLLTAAVSSTVPSASAAEDRDGIEVDLTAVSPAFLRPGMPLTVAGTLFNHTTSPVTDATVTLHLQRNAPRTRSAVDFWLDHDITFATLRLARLSLEGAIAPGESKAFRLTVPPEDFPIAAVPSAFGTRGIAVDATGANESGPLEGLARTLLVWYPGSTAQPTTLSVLVPLVPTASDLIGAALGGTPVAERSAQRIIGMAEATAGTPAVTWALDPVLLAGLDPVEPTPAPPGAAGQEPEDTPDQDAAGATADPDAASSPSPSTTTGGPSPAPAPAPTASPPATAADLPAVLRSLAQGREVIALPYADADAAATVHAGRTGLYDRALETGQDVMRTGGIVTAGDIVWPSATQPDTATIAMLARDGASSAILPEAALPLRSPLTYTPTGRGSIELTGDGVQGARTTMPALLSEGVLSAALAGSAPAPGRDTQSDAARSLDARQYLLAVTAMISRERPSDGRHVLAVLPRTFVGDPDALAERLASLDEAPWVKLATVSALSDRADPGLARAALPGERVEESEAPREMLDQIVTTSADLAQFADIADDPALLVRAEQLHLLQVTSAAWRSDTTGRVAFLNAATAAATAVQLGVGVLSGGTVNLISDTGDLPVTVRNSLDQPITAQLRLTPDGPSLRLPDVVTVEVPSGSEVAFPVRVHAVGSADVEVLAELTDATGRAVGTPATLIVRVRADWENVGTAIFAAFVGLAFIIGLVRSIRRSSRRGDSVPSPEDATT
jgi:hypothetical protein